MKSKINFVYKFIEEDYARDVMLKYGNLYEDVRYTIGRCARGD